MLESKPSRAISISISPFFWLLAALIGWLATQNITGTLIWMVVITISVLVHEYGHALTARAFGQGSQISLVGFGGLTTRKGPRLSSWKEFLVTLNGPLAGFALFFVASAIRALPVDFPPLLRLAIDAAVLINLLWSILNLLPVLPLDGGQLMRITLEGFFGLRGLKIALMASILMALAISGACIYVGAFLPGMLFVILGFESGRMWWQSLQLRQHDRDEDLQKLFQEGQDALDAGRTDEAFEKLQKVRETAKEGILYSIATQGIAAIHSARDEPQTAYELLMSVKGTLETESMGLLHHIAYGLKHFDVALDVGTKLYREVTEGETALLNAICCAHLRQDEPALGWLEAAYRDGTAILKLALAREVFDRIRNHPRFQELESSLKNS